MQWPPCWRRQCQSSRTNAIDYWLDAGGALPDVHRDGGLIMWEYNMDLGVMGEACGVISELRPLFSEGGLVAWDALDYILTARGTTFDSGIPTPLRHAFACTIGTMPACGLMYTDTGTKDTARIASRPANLRIMSARCPRGTIISTIWSAVPSAGGGYPRAQWRCAVDCACHARLCSRSSGLPCSCPPRTDPGRSTSRPIRGPIVHPVRTRQLARTAISGWRGYVCGYHVLSHPPMVIHVLVFYFDNWCFCHWISFSSTLSRVGQ